MKSYQIYSSNDRNIYEKIENALLSYLSLHSFIGSEVDEV